MFYHISLKGHVEKPLAVRMDKKYIIYFTLKKTRHQKWAQVSNNIFRQFFIKKIVKN